ncbi:transcription elongation factor GreA [Pseudodesulfovibrio piezophilus]|uniref:Transcription elongation factor GreA n=1 Tax=Pseudodesulfovibrio piezophilus (strain DSM 21447 / JCM 15486 / C1TLV30) TaxID=1322246 RepID=M1WQ62_PSEP2|nr:transcription elongation factor GreA [Pseudodesulfovibrio piezophilus]CCH48794.1 Transcription elongation factor greA [Pseudodesulfovibrio piezophilus C1TLV30]
MDRIPISTQGYEKIKQELEDLKAQRPAIIQAIKEAREEGDLSENAGYDAARERQGMLEARISYINSRMPLFDVLDLDTLNGDRAIFGATVEVEDIDTEEKRRFLLLGPDDANHKNGSISVMSPMGMALLGKEEGEEVIVEAPRGRIEYEILSVEFLGSKGLKLD